MRKTLQIGVSLAILALTVLTSSAHAAATSLDAFYTTMSTANPYTSQNYFQYNDVFSTYFSFSNVNSASPIELQWTWTGPASTGITTKEYAFTYDPEDPFFSFSKRSAGNTEEGKSFADWWKTTGRQPGDWNVVLAWKNGDTAGQTKAFDFKVGAAPEPISSVLFLVGGLAMGGNALRKKQQLA